MSDVIEKEYKLNLTLNEKEYQTLQKLLKHLEIKEYNDDSIVFSSDKNIVFYTKKSFITLAEELIINKAKLIHLNPFIGFKKLFNKIINKENLGEIN